MAELIEMPIGMLSGVDPKSMYYTGGPGARFTDIILRFVLRHVIRSSYDKS